MAEHGADLELERGSLVQGQHIPNDCIPARYTISHRRADQLCSEVASLTGHQTPDMQNAKVEGR